LLKSDKISETLKNSDYSHSKESRRKIGKATRLNMIKRIELALENGGQLTPWYNPTACEYFNQLMEQTGTHIQHAENGGEYHIKELGYWADGYSKEKNIIIEYDEPHHFNCDGTLKEKDVQRQKEIEEHFPGCKFIRIKQEK